MGSGPARAQRDDNKGTEFVLGFMENYTGSSNNRVLFITGETATTGTVEIPGLELLEGFEVTPGAITPVNIPLQAMVTGSDAVTNLGVHVTAGEEIVGRSLDGPPAMDRLGQEVRRAPRGLNPNR